MLFLPHSRLLATGTARPVMEEVLYLSLLIITRHARPLASGARPVLQDRIKLGARQVRVVRCGGSTDALVPRDRS